MRRAMICWGLAAVLGHAAVASGAGIAGIDTGVVIPIEDLDDHIDPGGSAAPYVGYMLNDYIGFMSQGYIWAASTDSPRVADEGVTWVGGLTIGPRLAIPLGRRLELNGTFQGGVFTALADEALTDTSWAFSVGGGMNYDIGDGWLLGFSARFNRLYQRVRGSGDAQYITAGPTLGYRWGVAEPEEMPMPPPPPVREEPVVQAPPPPPPVVERRIVLRGVHFDFDKAAIRPDAEPVLDEAIRVLQEEPGIAVIAEGHTDAIGSNEYNMKLSMRRARAVRDYLVQGGVSPDRIRVEGYGETRPVATNDTEDGRAQNRRVELRVVQD